MSYLDKLQPPIDITQSKKSVPNYLSKLQPLSQEEIQAIEERKQGGFGGFVKSLVSAPATIVARPFQAVAALGGVSQETLDKFSKEKLGGFVAPVPKSGSDVVKDIGRGFETVAFGIPVSKVAKGASVIARTFGASAKVAKPLGKIGAGVGQGYLFDVAAGLQSGEGAEAFKPGLGTVIGGALPVAGIAKDAVSKSVRSGAPRIVNSLIKPLKKDFSYGKNPGRAVAEEGIVANNMDDLLDRITERRQSIGEKIGSKLSTSSKKVNLSGFTAPLDDAISVANKAPRTNATLISRLESLKSDILGEVVNAEGEITMTRKLSGISPNEALEIKKLIGDLTKFTGNASDDGMVNKALKQLYGKVKEKINRAVPGVAQLNEKYADLTSAQIATKYRNEIIQRQNLIGFGPRTAGITAALITAISTGGSAIPSILVGLSAAGLDKVIGSTAVKTRIASLLAKQTSVQRTAFMKAIESASPAVKDALQKIIIQQTAKGSNLGRTPAP